MLLQYEVDHILNTFGEKSQRIEIRDGWHLENARAKREDNPPYVRELDVLILSCHGVDKQSLLIEAQKSNEAIRIWDYEHS